jgi:hypothetical protein
MICWSRHAWMGAAALSLVGCSGLLGYDDLGFVDDDAGTSSTLGGAAGNGGTGGQSDSSVGGSSGGTPGTGGSLVDGCKPLGCQELGANCGEIDDGCGTKVSCGTCAPGQVCGGGGTNKCGAEPCTPTTCAALKATCGSFPDGCSSTLECGTCQAPETCGGGGTANKCGCTKTSCSAAGAECGSLGDGCGGTLSCGSCAQPAATCKANKCECTPTSCAAKGYECGTLADGCGTNLNCGTCPSGEMCAGAGTPGQCAAPTGHHETKTNTGATGKETDGLIPVCCVPSAQEKIVIMEVFDLLNKHRQANGKPALTYDAKLEAAIEGHCHHMAAHDFFAHTAPESSVSSPWTRAGLCGTSAAGENIAAGQQTAAAVMQSWINSPGHNANMLGNFSRVGIGYFKGGSWGV